MGKIVIGKSGLHQCFLFTSMVICVKKLIMVDKQTMAYDGVSEWIKLQAHPSPVKESGGAHLNIFTQRNRTAMQTYNT